MKKLLVSSLIVGAMAGSLLAQGTVSFQATAGAPLRYSADGGTTITSIPVGSTVSTYGTLNVQVYSAPVGTASPFTATTASLLPSAWSASSTTPLHNVAPLPGWSALTTFALANATAGQNAQVMVVGWTGNFADWNSAYAAGTGLFGWTGSALSGGALTWSNGTGNPAGSPPTQPVSLVTGAAGYNGLVLQSMSVIPEPSTFALAGLGVAALLIFRRRK